ncbi:hypothetical protein M422DRAFT_54231 [Sphaerobolus stellatus SS14]|uniref:Uncharacterized protein n=1 Tax=Sphaerobolus stellatus (strain SS14) TaxID=990650 RepID=A0A0C9UVD3_SPHS4|nr:hypothetical protein M422DRAFT_54231 [Sphaerobolus stellatus SS14]
MPKGTSTLSEEKTREEEAIYPNKKCLNEYRVESSGSENIKITEEENVSNSASHYVVVTFIRHGQSTSNVEGLGRGQGDNEPLTALGIRQAQSRGVQYEDVRIDFLLSSPLVWAFKTANAITEQNCQKPEVMKLDIMKEQDHGHLYRTYISQGRYQSAAALRFGDAFENGGLPSRDYRTSGGESLDDLIVRGSLLLYYLKEYAVELDAPPQELSSEYQATGQIDELPQGIPHVVVISHNIFLSEFYEALLAWHETEHVFKNINFQNIES